MEIPPTALASFIGAVTGALITFGANRFLAKKNQVLTMRQTAVQELARIEGLFYQYPKLYKYFHESSEDFPDNDTRNQAIAISHNYMKIFAILVLHKKEFPDIFSDWVDKTIENRYKTSPILVETMLRFQDEYNLTGKIQMSLMPSNMKEIKEELLKNEKIDSVLNYYNKPKVIEENSSKKLEN